jgi:rhamnosyltransferase
LKLPYDEDLTGLEDLDWAKRAMSAGYQLSYVAEASVGHVHQERFLGTKNRYKREAIAYKRIFPGQRMSLTSATRYALGNILSDYYHAARSGRLMRNLLDIPRFRVAQFWGSYSGFRQRGPMAESLVRHFYYPNGLKREREAVGEAEGRRIQYEELSRNEA